MAAGGFSVADASTDYSTVVASRIQWYEGRHGALLGFAPDGRLIAHIVRGRHITPQEDAWLRLALAIFRLTPLRFRLGRSRASGKRVAL